MSGKLYIFDTTLRDGEQVPGCQLNTAEKIKVAKQLELLGVDIIEAGFPVSSPGDFNSVVEISKAVTWPTICALTRAVEKDITVAAEALRFAKHKRIHTGIGTSDQHIKYKFKSTRERIIEQAVAAVKFARNLVDEVEFYADWAIAGYGFCAVISSTSQNKKRTSYEMRCFFKMALGDGLPSLRSRSRTSQAMSNQMVRLHGINAVHGFRRDLLHISNKKKHLV